MYLKHLLPTLLCLVCLSPTAFSQKIGAAVPVYTADEAGYQCFRIPAIVAAPNGTLLAFAEGRRQNCGDFGDVDIVLKRSTDGGRTWSPLAVVVEFDSLQAGNPAPVWDHTDPQFPKGRLFLFYNTGNASEHAVRNGKGQRDILFVASADGGATWSAPKNITAQVKLQDWRSYANTPGHAIQLTHGPKKGRLYVAANHSSGAPKNDFTDYQSHGFFSDDHGQSFQLSATVRLPGSNEAMAVQTENSGLLMYIRNQTGTPRCRIFAKSSDSGATWDSVWYNRSRIDPVCQGSVLALGKIRGKQTLAFCNPFHEQNRTALTLQISQDEGLTFRPLLLEPAMAAYSDLVALGKKHIGVLYERDDYRTIVFRRVQWR